MGALLQFSTMYSKQWHALVFLLLPWVVKGQNASLNVSVTMPDGNLTLSLNETTSDGSETDGLLVQVGGVTYEVEDLGGNISVDQLTGTTSAQSENGTTVLMNVVDEDGNVQLLEWFYSGHASDVCTLDAAFCLPVSKFQNTGPFHHDWASGQEVDEATKNTWRAEIKAVCDDIGMLAPGMCGGVIEELVDHYEESHDKKLIVLKVSGSAVEVHMLAVGLVVSDIEEIDYQNGDFTVDLRVYVQKVRYNEPYTSVADAMKNAWGGLDNSSVTSTAGSGYVKLLPDEYISVKDQVKFPEKPILDGRCNSEAVKSTEPVTKAEYTHLSGGGGFGIDRSKATLVPVSDEQGNILYLESIGAKIKFQPVNAQYFPFQINILDIILTTTPTRFFLHKKIDLYSFCVHSTFTGFKAPLPSLPNNGELYMIPTVIILNSAPWYNERNGQMHLTTTGYSTTEQDTPEKFHQGASFRIVYKDETLFNSFMVLLPFLFTAFTTQLQWLVAKPETFTGASMVTSVLLIQNLISSQKSFIGTRSIATNVIYITYAVTGVYVSCVAVMTCINLAKEAGQMQRVAKRQAQIYRYFRLVGLLLTPLYVPIIWVQSDVETGEQFPVPWLWPVVGSLCLFVLAIRVVMDVRIRIAKARKAKLAALELEQKEKELATLSHLGARAFSSYTIEDVKQWIANSTDLAEACRYMTKEDLQSIANKFSEAKIDGNALLRSATDTKILVQYVGLPVGMAINFSDAFKILLRGGSIKLEALEMSTLSKLHNGPIYQSVSRNCDESV